MYYSCLLGNPVDHSISPSLFNLLAKKTGLEYAHIKILVPHTKDLASLLSALNTLHFNGANVTLPYKLAIIPLIDKLDESAKQVGAVNTIIFTQNGTVGYNTDTSGAITAIENKLKPIAPEDKILVIGAGGAARAISYEIYKQSRHITILNRTLEHAQKVSQHLSKDQSHPIKIAKLTSENFLKYANESTFIINATSVGMYPDINQSLFPANIFAKIKNISSKFFFDAIFNPYETQFLQNAKIQGAKTCSGLYMMIYQGIAAFHLWTGQDASDGNIDLWAHKLEQELTKINNHGF